MQLIHLHWQTDLTAFKLCNEKALTCLLKPLNLSETCSLAITQVRALPDVLQCQEYSAGPTLLPPKCSCNHWGLQRDFPSIGVRQYAGKWESQNFLKLVLLTLRKCKAALSSGQCKAVARPSVRRVWHSFSLPTSTAFWIITCYSSPEALTQAYKNTFHFLWPCSTTSSPFAGFIAKFSLDWCLSIIVLPVWNVFL